MCDIREEITKDITANLQNVGANLALIQVEFYQHLVIVRKKTNKNAFQVYHYNETIH